MSVPPLDASADEVVAWLLGHRHLEVIDEDGRALGEQASDSYDARRDERRTFGDARDDTGLPCNTAALAQVRCVWPALLAALRGLDADRPPTFHRILRRTIAATDAAKLTALASPAPLPREIAALYKITIGFSDLVTALHLDGSVDADAAPGPEDELSRWLDARPFLIGERQVCAGTRAQIRTVWRALSESGPRDARWDAPWMARALAASSEVAALAAAAAGAARAFVTSGRLAEDPSYGTFGHVSRFACLRLFDAPEVPRLCEALRKTRDGGALHATLLFPSDAVPRSLCTFLDAVPDAARSEAPLAATDTILLRCASPIAASLLEALGRPASPLTLDAFRRSCR